MNSYTEPNGMYGAIQVMALDAVFRLWTDMLAARRQRTAPSEPQAVVAVSQAADRALETAPAPCGC